jgi:hypothetical protein
MAATIARPSGDGGVSTASSAAGRNASSAPRRAFSRRSGTTRPGAAGAAASERIVVMTDPSRGGLGNCLADLMDAGLQPVQRGIATVRSLLLTLWPCITVRRRRKRQKALFGGGAARDPRNGRGSPYLVGKRVTPNRPASLAAKFWHETRAPPEITARKKGAPGKGRPLGSQRVTQQNEGQKSIAKPRWCGK